jgi:hypothetical protein
VCSSDLRKEEKERKIKWETRVLFGPHDDFATKDQTGVLKRIEVEPTIPDILERMNGNSTQEEVKPRRRRRSTRSAEEEDVKQWDVEK